MGIIIECNVKTHGGKIEAESEEDEGSVFTVTLPVQLLNNDF